MKNFISLLLCAALIFVCMSGCQRQQEVPETTIPTVPIEEVPLTLPADARPYAGTELRFLSLLSESDPRADVLKQAAGVFEARTGAEILFYWLDENEKLLHANIESGMEIDIFAASSDMLGDGLWAQALDLTQMAENAGYGDHSYRALRDQIIGRCGFLAAIAQEPCLYGVYYNADTIADAGITDFPESWDDFLSFSEALTQKGIKPLAMDSENTHIVLELHLERHLGIETFKTLMGQGGWTQKTDYIDLFRLAIEYAEAGYLAKGDPAAFPAGQDKLALSNVAMTIGSNALCAQVEESTMMDVNWGVFPYPGDGPGTGYSVESYALAVHKDSPNVQAAFDFIMLLTTGEFDQLYADVCGGIPADPANECAIAGAQSLLEHADVRGIGLLSSKDNLLYTRLWNGWYKTPGYFASALNGLAKDYAPLATDGVG